MTDSRTIVFVHGMYMTPLCWESWIDRYESHGRHCLAPAWPGRNLPVEQLRAMHPDPDLARLTLTQVVESYEKRIQDLPRKPVLVGHSMGGLVVQLLLQKGIAAAGVAIDSAPPQGVFTARWSFVRANWPHINPLVSKDTPATLSFERFQYAFVHNLSPQDQRLAYLRYVVPESRRVPAESLTAKARIDFDRPHAPLMFVAGSDDHIIPASLNQTNYRRYTDKGSVTEFREFNGMAHFIIGQAGWDDVADAVEEWLEEQGLIEAWPAAPYRRPAVEAGEQAAAHS